MVEQNQMNQIISELCEGISSIFPHERMDPILFGSYARGDAEDESDIDVLLLVDTPREEIFQRNRQIGDVAGDLLLSYGILVSPIVENRAYFDQNVDLLPFFRNIQREGVHLYV